ncbi:site-specific integrase [Pedobacter sp. Du54]|uniref:site-specific integrase n=1 Tax=Pedobacter anseongensis TaxID=3133439 RepID=UPI00309DB5B2
MSQNYSLHFYLKKPKNYQNGPKFIYMRISAGDLIAKDASIGRSIDPENWNSAANRAKGVNEISKTLNSYIEGIERNVEQIHTYLIRNQIDVTPEAMMNKYLKKGDVRHNLMEVFAEHNRKMEASIGLGFKANTLKGYKSSVNHLNDYLQKDFRAKDIDICKIDHAFITGYEFFLRTDKKISDISTAKYMKHFRKIINLCLAHRWIEFNPFVFYKNKARPKEKEFLTKHELQTIYKKKLEMPRLELVRDIFVFSCYTGLSYADVKKLQRSEIGIGDDGELWIFTSREKNDNSSNIPLLDIPKKLMDKYKNRLECKHDGLVMPILSNQKMNAYLKEIADICKIKKVLTFHIARHTFATTVTLSNNVPIETVSKMLGHKDIRTTQHYAKVLDEKIGRDMRELNNKLRKFR